MTGSTFSSRSCYSCGRLLSSALGSWRFNLTRGTFGVGFLQTVLCTTGGKKKPSHARWRPARPDLHDLRPIGGSHMDRLHLRGNSCHTNCKKRMVRMYRSSICVGIIVSSWSGRPLRCQNNNGSKGTNRTSAEARTSCYNFNDNWPFFLQKRVGFIFNNSVFVALHVFHVLWLGKSTIASLHRQKFDLKNCRGQI